MPSNLLDDFLELAAFASEVKRHPRTVKRWLNQPKDPLPYTTCGKTILVHVPSAREWLMNRMENVRRPTRKRKRRR